MARLRSEREKQLLGLISQVMEVKVRLLFATDDFESVDVTISKKQARRLVDIDARDEIVLSWHVDEIGYTLLLSLGW